MTPDQFKAWFEGFCEAIDAAPTPEQWARLDPFQRYVLAKLSRKPEGNHDFIPAMTEFGIAASGHDLR